MRGWPSAGWRTAAVAGGDDGHQAVTIFLKAANGRIVRQWASPANASTQIQAAWHVFDVDGRHGRDTAMDDLLADRTLSNVHVPDIDVCPE
jgi:hypothetical protein